MINEEDGGHISFGESTQGQKVDYSASAKAYPRTRGLGDSCPKIYLTLQGLAYSWHFSSFCKY